MQLGSSYSPVSQCGMAYFRRKRIGKRKFRALERDSGERIESFIPRRMDLVPDAVRCALPIYYTEDLTLFTAHFPFPIYRTVNLMKFAYHWYRRVMMDDGSPATGAFQQRFPNNHWSVDHPFGVQAEGLPYLASKYQNCLLNGSKATIGVTVRMRADPLLSVTGGAQATNPGIPIDCWLGSPASPKEMRALQSYWAPIRYLQEMDESVETMTNAVIRQFHDGSWWAKSLYGSSRQLVAPGDLDTAAEMPWAVHSNLMPESGGQPSRPELRWLMQQTTEEGPNRFKHSILFPSAPGRKPTYKNSASMKAVYNPQAYWGSFIKEERVIEPDLEDKVDPRDFMDALKLYELSSSTAGSILTETWSTDDGTEAQSTSDIAVIPEGIEVISAANSMFDLGHVTEADGEGGGLRMDQIMPHLWLILIPRNTTDDPDTSWTWPSTAVDDLDGSESERRLGLQLTFGVKQKFYMIFMNRRDSEDMNDVLTED